MASDDNSAKIPNASPAHGSPPTVSHRPTSGSGKGLPPTGKVAPARLATESSTASATAATKIGTVKPAASAEPKGLVDQLNKHLNDSGLPDQFRLDPAGNLIQQVNPSTGEVISELPVSEFPALARSVGASGLLLDTLA